MNKPSTQDPGDESPLAAALAEYMLRIDAGEAVDRAQFIAQHADVADGLREYFATADAVEQLDNHGSLTPPGDLPPEHALTVDSAPDLGSPVVQASPLAHFAGGKRDRDRLFPIRLNCPHCQNAIAIIDDSAGEDVICPSCGSSFHLDADRTLSWAPEKLPRLGKFELLEAIGQGAFGTVYRARDTELDRLVAVKVPRSGAFAAKVDEDRFVREARSAAQLSHPGIVPVFEVGRSESFPYIVSELIDGISLAEYLTGRRFGFHDSAELIAAVADAVHYAHERGVVHRDLKPANILLQSSPPLRGGLASSTIANQPDAPDLQLRDASGHPPIPPLLRGGRGGARDPSGSPNQTPVADAHGSPTSSRDETPVADARGSPTYRPRVLDFGLARRDEGEITVTLDGQVLGTPAYMSPEQARGEAHAVDGRADVYSLGVILYQLLTGELPFRGSSRMLLHQVLRDEPTPPRKLNDRIPRDLETICLKSLAKEPTRRYPTAAALAADLRRYLTGVPILARPVSRSERLYRWCRRNPMISTLSAAVLLSLFGGTGVSTFFAVRAEINAKTARENEILAKSNESRALKGEGDARSEAERTNRLAADEALARKESERQLNRSEWLVYSGQIALAQREWQDGNVGHARDLLDACRRDFRGWEHDYLFTLFNQNQRTLRLLREHDAAVVVSADGKRIVSGGRDHTVKVWDAASGQVTLTLKGHAHLVHGVAFSPDDKRIASGSWDKTVKVWDVANGWATHSLRGHADAVVSVAFSPDGKRIASGSWDHAVKVWDASSGQEVFTFKGHSNRVTSVAFSPKGKRIASGSWDHTVKVWETSSGQVTLTFKGHSGYVSSVAFSADTKRIVSGSWDNTVRVWDAKSGQETLKLKGHAGHVNSVAFNSDGKRIVSGSDDRTVKLWDVTSGAAILTLKGHIHSVTSVAFSTDGKRIVSAAGAELKVWDAHSIPRPMTLKGHALLVSSVAFSADGKRIISGSHDQRVAKVWDAHNGQEMLTLIGHTVGVPSVAISSDGTRIASGGTDKTVKVWDGYTGQKIKTLNGHTQRVTGVAFSADGKRIVSGSDDKTARVWDAQSGKQTLTLAGHAREVTCVAFSADGKWIVSGSWDDTVKVWDAQSGQEVLTLNGHGGRVFSVAFSGDGKRVLSGGDDKTVKVWDALNGREILTLKGHASMVLCVAFSPDGKRIVSGSADGTMKVWDAQSGQLTLTLKGYGPFAYYAPEVSSVAFSRDGKRIVSGNGDTTIRVWDATMSAPKQPDR